MKKLLMAVAALGMLLTSCQNDLDFVPTTEETATVSFEVGTPEIATRVYSDGKTATVLQYAVYDAEGNILRGLTKTDATINGSTTVNLQLVTGDTYHVIFWAAANGAPYTVNFTDALADATMTVNYTGVLSNNENLDAFYKYHTFTVKGAQTETIELKRPFAQLNIGTADFVASEKAGYVPATSTVTVKNIYNTLKLKSGAVDGQAEVTFAANAIPANETFPVAGNEYLAMNYLLVAADKENVDIQFTFANEANEAKTRTVGSVPVQRNYRTNIYGNLLTSSVDINVEIKPDYEEPMYEANLQYVVENGGEVKLTEDVVLEKPLTVKAGKVAVIDLNGYTLSATSTKTGANYNMIDVRGTLTVKNGTMEYKHEGQNMEWSNSTNLFNVTAGGVLNLEGVTAKNLGGSDMAFVAHLNNWGEVTLNVENSTLESTYIPVRVFNSGPDMNNVTIKNSTLKGKYAFWVHNYTVEDFGSVAKAEAQKALLNFNIYNQDNTFSPDVNGILYGFTNSIKTDAYGITKSVSDDGTEVTLGSLVEDGLIRRGVAGDEENTTVKKVVVEEGVATLYDRTFRRFYALEEVVLPSTLTTIGAAGSGVFQSCSALKNIVIPESVTVLGKGTFYGCSSLESINIPAGVTRIEENCLRETALEVVEFHAGVTYFGAQAFRDCKKLKEVYINAPEFTIAANAFGSMAAPYPAATIYVANAEMKTYLENTLTYAKQFAIVAPTVASTQDELNSAIVNNDKTIALAEGTYVLPNSAQGKTLKFVGTGDPAKTIIATNSSGSYEGCNYNLSGSNVVFENISMTTDNNTYTGYSRCNATFNNCIINNSLTLYGDMVFNNCVFNVSGDQYNIWTWAAPTATFNGCTFNSDGKAVLLYGGGNTVLTVNNCTFNDTGVLPDLKAAIEVGSDYGTSYFDLIVNNTVVNGYEINDKGINTGTTLWGNKNSIGQDKLNVVVDGVDVY